ncbi:MAG: feruloyl-CoA synthetase, partial [Hyphomicrobiales bacterium]
MYSLNLSKSHFPAHTEIDIREITIGELLREIAHERPNAEALVEVRQDGEVCRRWTYGELLAEAENLALSLSTRF